MIILKELKNRAEFARNKLKLTKKAVAKAVGLSEEGYRSIETGKSVSPRNREKLVKVLNVDEGWLFLKNGGVVVYTEEGEAIPVSVNHVPLFGLDQVSQNMEFAKIKNKDDMVPMCKNCSINSYAVVVKGDSMTSPYPGKISFLEGEILIIDPDKIAKNGDFVIIKNDNNSEAIFKKYVCEGNNEYFMSLNPEYKEILFDKTFKILGVVVGKQAYFN